MDNLDSEIGKWQENFLPEKHWIERLTYLEFAQIHIGKKNTANGYTSDKEFENAIKTPLKLIDTIIFHTQETVTALRDLIIEIIDRVRLEHYRVGKNNQNAKENIIQIDSEKFVIEYDDFQNNIFNVLTSLTQPANLGEAICEINYIRSMMIWINDKMILGVFNGREEMLWTPIILSEIRISKIVSFCSGWINRLPYELQTPKKSLRAINKEKSERERKENTEKAILNLLRTNFTVYDIFDKNLSSRNKLVNAIKLFDKAGGESTIRDIIYEKFKDRLSFPDDLKAFLADAEKNK